MRDEASSSEILEATKALCHTWRDIGPICVKHDNGAFGVATWQGQEPKPVAIYIRNGQPDQADVIRDQTAPVVQFTGWKAAALAGWRLD